MFLPSDVNTSLRIAWRAQFPVLAAWCLVALAGVALLAAQFSGRQPATVALDVGISFLRLAFPLLAILLVQELISKEFERRLFLTSLTYPRPRHHFLLGRFAAVLILSMALLTLAGSLLAALVSYVGSEYTQSRAVALDRHFVITLLFVGVDLFTVASMALFIAVVAPTPSFVLIGTTAFALIARSFAAIISLITREQDVVTNPELYRNSLGLLGWLLPDLGALDVRMITLYGSMEFLPGGWPSLVGSVLAYGLALIALAVWALNRKRFA